MPSIMTNKQMKFPFIKNDFRVRNIWPFYYQSENTTYAQHKQWNKRSYKEQWNKRFYKEQWNKRSYKEQWIKGENKKHQTYLLQQNSHQNHRLMTQKAVPKTPFL